MKKIVSADRIAILLAILCLGAALLIRLWNLELKPLHHDEGVNGWFLLRLYNNNFYNYDPSNYHGPFLYYLGLIPFYLAGISTFSFRIMPALFGVLTIALLIPLRRRMGLVGVITAGVLLALSPANVFYSRYAIHEVYLIFFTLATVVAWLFLFGSRKSIYLYLAAASLAFMITVKETYIITLGVLALSLVLSWLLNFVFSRNPGSNLLSHLKLENVKNLLAPQLQLLWSETKRRRIAIIGCLLIFSAIIFLLYSSFFTYFKGVQGLLSTLKIWSRTGLGSSGHEKHFLYYFEIFFRGELPILVFGIIGLLYCLRKKDTFSLFISFWGIGMFLAYSLIPYKTPWLIINLILPMALASGIFLQGVISSTSARGGGESFLRPYSYR